jgi:alkylation response protein AidB-like acyl-CoA dehydrogenase
VNFDLDADQIALRDAIRELCRGRAPLDKLRATGGSIDEDLWRALGEAGVFSLRLSEDLGGLGRGVADAVVVFEELGRALIPGPIVATHLAAGWIDGAAAGEEIVGFLDTSARPLVVEHYDDVDILIAADEEGRLLEVDWETMDVLPVARPLDPLTPLHTPLAWEAVSDGKEHSIADWHTTGAVLTAALLVGISDRVTELAVAYAKERKQFGRVIGSFQAVKHLCADMVTRTEVARAAVYAAGCVLDDPPAGEEKRAAAAAKLLATDAALANGKTAVQVYGGMGFTWEMDVHLYLKRAAVLATHFGSSDEKAEVVAACL